MPAGATGEDVIVGKANHDGRFERGVGMSFPQLFGKRDRPVVKQPLSHLFEREQLHFDVEEFARFLASPNIHDGKFVVSDATLIERIQNLQFSDRGELGSRQHGFQN